jgi:hypothetical protein
MLKRQKTQQEMTKNAVNRQNVSIKRTCFLSDRVLLFEQVTEKANTSHFLKFLLSKSTNGTLGFTLTHKANVSQNQKIHFLAKALKYFMLNSQPTLKVKVL